jgi:hypothetical protein
MAITTHYFRRGAPVQIAQLVTTGTLETGHSARARMKPYIPERPEEMPGDDVANVSPAFTSTILAGTPQSIVHTLFANESAEIPAGKYIFDTSILLDGVVISTSAPEMIVMQNSASAVVA